MTTIGDRIRAARLSAVPDARDAATPPAVDLRVLSLGAGVQSTTVYLMALAGDLPLPDMAIFADTGWEPKAVYAHLIALAKMGAGRLPITRVSSGNLRQDVLDALDSDGKVGHIGQPPFYVRNGDGQSGPDPDRGGMLWRKCTTEYKIEPINRKIRELLGFTNGQRIAGKAAVQQWLGISVDEAHRMRDSRVPWIENYYPLVELRMSRQDCVRWLREHGHAIPRKSACLGCPYHSGGTWREMRDHRPEEWADVREFDAALRRGKLPGVTGDAYLHRAMVPLPEAVDRTHDPQQTDLFGGECEGVCGV